MKLCTSVLTALLLLAPALPARAAVSISFREGKVTLVARDATLRQVLVAWEAAGGTKITNRDRVPNLAVTIDIVDTPEARALAILLRPLGGYVLTVRDTLPVPGVSSIEKLIILTALASSAPAPVSASQQMSPRPSPAQMGQPFRGGPPSFSGMVNPNSPGDEPDNEQPTVGGSVPMMRPPFGAPRQMRDPANGDQSADENQPAPPMPNTVNPTVPTTATRPGALPPPKLPSAPLPRPPGI